MMDLNSFTYYEIEAIKELVDSKITLNYRMRDKYPNLYSNENKETNELMLIQVKITQHMATLERPSNIQRIKDGKKINK